MGLGLVVVAARVAAAAAPEEGAVGEAEDRADRAEDRDRAVDLAAAVAVRVVEEVRDLELAAGPLVAALAARAAERVLALEAARLEAEPLVRQVIAEEPPEE